MIKPETPLSYLCEEGYSKGRKILSKSYLLVKFVEKDNRLSCQAMIIDSRNQYEHSS